MTSFGGLIGGFEEPRRYGGMLGVMGRGPVMGGSLGSMNQPAIWQPLKKNLSAFYS